TDERLREIFHAWIEHRAASDSSERTERALKDESAKVYQEMWHAFAAYCGLRGLDLQRIRQDEIRAFLIQRAAGNGSEKARVAPKGANLSPRYTWRVLTLIDRVTRFHAQGQRIAPNPAARDLLELPEYRYANASHRDPLPEYYSDAQVTHLIAQLTQPRDPDSPEGPMSWKEVRDRTVIAMMLGGGLTPGDARGATLDGIFTESGAATDVPWKLALPGNGNAPARETPLAHWAGEQLAVWLSVRAAHRIAGNFIFPSTLSGKPLSHTSCHETCKAVLAGAGFVNDSGGVFKLRHTFALRQLASGKDENDVARWLGLLDINSMEKYRRVVTQPVDVV
ncbi:MAG: tyrosine-type recombinase/integrase, partial [Noviherbaspirillum sp.]